MSRPIAERAGVDTVDSLKRRRSLSKIQKIAVTATALFVFSQFTPIDGPENSSQKTEKLCATPDVDDIELVTDLFESAADQFFTSKYEQGQRFEDEHGLSGRFPEKAAIDIRARAAKILGLTVYDYLEVSELQDKSSSTPDTRPKSQSEEYLDSFNAATDFLSLYGVDLITTDPEYTFAFDGRELTQTELEDGRGTSILRE